MNVIVTGTAGLIGSHLADALLAQGHRVFGVDSLIGGYADNVPMHERYAHRAGDVRGGLHAEIKTVQADVVYHCAALAYEGLSVFSPALIGENILGGTAAAFVLAKKAGAKRFVNFSSMARYGLCAPPFEEEDEPRPCDPYGIAKLAAEKTLNVLGATHGIKVVHAVPHNVIGPRQAYTDPYRNVAAIMINRALQDKPLIVYGDGEQRRCFTFVRDVLGVLISLADCTAWHGEVFNVGPDEEDGDGPITINELTDVIGRAVGEKVKVMHHPPRPCEVRQAWCAADKIRARFGWKQATTLEAGIAEMVEWIRRRGPRPFDYRLPLEIEQGAPQTWREKLL